MADRSGFACEIVRFTVKRDQIKPFLRKPFLNYFSLLAMAGHIFEVGLVLAAKHRAHLDEFGAVFLGLEGKTGAIQRFFNLRVKEALPLLNEHMSIIEYIQAEQMKTFNYTGDSNMFIVDFGRKKIPAEAAFNMMMGFAEEGAALGAMYPDVARSMFKYTHKPINRKDWNRYRDLGLNIPTEQDVMSYEENERCQNESFMAYCQECFPSFHSILA